MTSKDKKQSSSKDPKTDDARMTLALGRPDSNSDEDWDLFFQEVLDYLKKPGTSVEGGSVKVCN